MEELFGCSADNISLQLKNIYAEEEPSAEATAEDFSVVQTDRRQAFLLPQMRKSRKIKNNTLPHIDVMRDHAGSSGKGRSPWSKAGRHLKSREFQADILPLKD